MSGVKGATGQPLTLKCSQCRRSSDEDVRRRAGMCLMNTGVIRPRKLRNALGRMEQMQRQIFCTRCGHYGWTAHPQAKHLPIGPELDVLVAAKKLVEFMGGAHTPRQMEFRTRVFSWNDFGELRAAIAATEAKHKAEWSDSMRRRK